MRALQLSLDFFFLFSFSSYFSTLTTVVLVALPPVDSVEITTVMDNSLDLLMSSTPVAHRFPLPQYGDHSHPGAGSTRM
jgi:hypothetical protein